MQSLTRQTLKIYWSHSKAYPLAAGLVLIGLLGLTLTQLYIPFWYKRMFDLIAQSAASPMASRVLPIVYAIALLNVVNWGFRRIFEFSLSFFEARVISNLLNTCFSYLHRHSYGFFTGNFTGTLVRRVNRYVRSFEDIADELLLSIGQTALRVLGMIVVLYFWHWHLAAALLGWFIVFSSFNYRFALWKLKYDRQKAETDSEITGRLADTITNSVNLKLFGGLAKEQSAFRALTQKLYKISLKTWNLGNSLNAIQSLFLTGLELVVLYLAIKLWERGMLTIGDFALIQTYLISIFYKIWDVSRSIRKIFESLADAEEMTQVLTGQPEIRDRKNASSLRANNGRIEFQNVDFGYHQDLEVLSRFSLTVSPGERVALVGPSGGGKSTIVKLLLRFYDLQGGRVLIDGQDIATVTQDSLREAIALVPQEPILFHRSLFENIRYARERASDGEIIKAAKLAHAHEFISKFPDGYDTFVGERGVKLSGGERQRVAIARAILKNAPILVLDEATSSLDSESEYLIQDALRNLMKGRTTIVIAHRLSTIMQMDRIVVIENGRILEEGKHKELVKAKEGTYQRLWNIQAGGFMNV